MYKVKEKTKLEKDNELEESIKLNNENFRKLSKILEKLLLKIEPILIKRSKELELIISDDNRKNEKSNNLIELEKINKSLRSFDKLRSLFILKIRELELFLVNAEKEYKKYKYFRLDNFLQSDEYNNDFFEQKEILYGLSYEGKKINEKYFDTYLSSFETKYGLVDFSNKILYDKILLKSEEDIEIALQKKEIREEIRIKNDFTKFLIFLAPNIYRNYDFSFLPNYKRRKTYEKSLIQYIISINNLRNSYIKFFYPNLKKDNEDNIDAENEKIDNLKNKDCFYFYSKNKIIKKDKLKKSFQKDLFFFLEATFIWTKKANRNILINSIKSIFFKLKDNISLDYGELNNFICNSKKELDELRFKVNKDNNLTWEKSLNNSHLKISDSKKRRMYNSYSHSIFLRSQKIINANKIKNKKDKYKSYLMLPDSLNKTKSFENFWENNNEYNSIINFNDDLIEIFNLHFIFLNNIKRKVIEYGLEEKINHNFFISEKNKKKILKLNKELKLGYFKNDIFNFKDFKTIFTSKDLIFLKEYKFNFSLKNLNNNFSILESKFRFSNKNNTKEENSFLSLFDELRNLKMHPSSFLWERDLRFVKKVINLLTEKINGNKLLKISFLNKNLIILFNNAYSNLNINKYNKSFNIFIYYLIIIILYNYVIDFDVKQLSSHVDKENFNYLKGITLSYKNSLLGIRKIENNNNVKIDEEKGSIFSLSKYLFLKKENNEKKYKLSKEDRELIFSYIKIIKIFKNELSSINKNK
ncbi:MAG: hypothetical protein TYPL_0250 [Candidatus Tyloplasma litorale]|nr:MAG: hypothetical protein TYPL_0250 [Mycoplasmatales bacterium]